MKNHKDKSDGKFGYRPLNEGYTPIEKRGYTGKANGIEKVLPKAPVGGTGKTQAATVGSKDSGKSRAK